MPKPSLISGVLVAELPTTPVSTGAAIVVAKQPNALQRFNLAVVRAPLLVLALWMWADYKTGPYFGERLTWRKQREYATANQNPWSFVLLALVVMWLTAPMAVVKGVVKRAVPKALRFLFGAESP